MPSRWFSALLLSALCVVVLAAAYQFPVVSARTAVFPHASAAKRPSAFVAFGGHKALEPQERADGRYKTNFHHVDQLGRHVRLEADVQVHPGVVSLDGKFGESVHGLACSASTDVNRPGSNILLSFNTMKDRDEASHVLEQNEYLVGSPRWGCTTVSGRDTTILSKIVGVHRLEDAHTLGVETEAATYSQIFKDAVIAFSTNQHQGPQVVQQPPSSSPGNTHAGFESLEASPDRRKISWWPWSAITQGIEDAAEDVVTAVTDVAHAVKKVVTYAVEGSYKDNWSNMESFSWNLDSNYYIENSQISLFEKTSSGSTPDDSDSSLMASYDASVNVYCADCYALLYGTVYYNIVISDYDCLTASGGIKEGYVNVNMNVTSEAEAELTFNAGPIELLNLPTSSLPSIAFSIGPIPVYIQFEFEVSAEYEATISAKGSLSGAVHMAGSINQVGFTYDYRNSPRLSPVSEQKIGVTGDIHYDFQINIENTVTLTPKLSLIVDKLVNVKISPIPVLNVGLSAEFSNENSDCHLQLTSSVDLNINLEVGTCCVLFICEITLPGTDVALLDEHTWGPLTMFTDKFPLINKCLIPGQNDDSNLSARAKSTDMFALDQKSATPKTEYEVGKKNLRARHAGTTCTNNCSGNGVCNFASECVCYSGYSGADCSAYEPSDDVSHRRQCTAGACQAIGPEVAPFCSQTIGESFVCSADVNGMRAKDDLVASSVSKLLAAVGPQCAMDFRYLMCSVQFPRCEGSGPYVEAIPISTCQAALQKCGYVDAQAKHICHIISSSPSSPVDVALSVDEDGKLPSSAPRGVCTKVDPTDMYNCGSSSTGSPVFLYTDFFSHPADADALVGSFLDMIGGTNKAQSSSSSAPNCASAIARMACAETMPACIDSDSQGPASDHDSSPSTAPMCHATCEDALSACSTSTFSSSFANTYCAPDSPLARYFIAAKSNTEFCGYSLRENALTSTPLQSLSPSFWSTTVGYVVMAAIAVGGLAIVITTVVLAVRTVRRRRARLSAHGGAVLHPEGEHRIMMPLQGGGESVLRAPLLESEENGDGDALRV